MTAPAFSSVILALLPFVWMHNGFAIGPLAVMLDDPSNVTPAPAAKAGDVPVISMAAVAAPTAVTALNLTFLITLPLDL
jgi:hypothetical protein